MTLAAVARGACAAGHTGWQSRPACEPRATGATPTVMPVRAARSSRFGKFLKLYFDKSAKIRGAALSTYLLEKSRVTHIGQGERAYHIFYNVLRGMPANNLKALRLPSSKVTDFKCVASGPPPATPNQESHVSTGASSPPRAGTWRLAILTLARTTSPASQKSCSL